MGHAHQCIRDRVGRRHIGDGGIVIGAAVAAAAGFVSSAWYLRWIGSIGALAVAGYDWSNLQSRIADVNSSTEFAEASVGWGLWAVLIGAAAALVASVLVPKHAKLLG